MSIAALTELIHILGPVFVALAPLLKPLLDLIGEELSEGLEDHAEYSKTDEGDDALGARLRARIERVWPENDRDARP